MDFLKKVLKHPATWAALGVVAGLIAERKLGLVTKVGLGAVILPSV